MRCGVRHLEVMVRHVEVLVLLPGCAASHCSNTVLVFGSAAAGFGVGTGISEDALGPDWHTKRCRIYNHEVW